MQSFLEREFICWNIFLFNTFRNHIEVVYLKQMTNFSQCLLVKLKKFPVFFNVLQSKQKLSKNPNLNQWQKHYNIHLEITFVSTIIMFCTNFKY